jgi:hypothetical protein
MIPATRLTRFKAWLLSNGADILEPTNEWELLRFRGNSGTSIIYTKKGGQNTFANEAAKAWECFNAAKPWRAIQRSRRANLTPVVKTLIKRDGHRCFFCGFLIPDGDETVDHLVAKTSGGPDHASNFVLMHDDCNSMCGHRDAAWKIRAHVEWKVCMSTSIINHQRRMEALYP